MQANVISLIHPGLKKLIYEKGWKGGLTDIQKTAIPFILNGENCIIEAPTAGGKTEAVFFPCLTKAAETKNDSVQILYLAPLRALLNDIELRAKEYSEACGLHCFKWHGDVSQKEKITAFNNPPNVLLTTPESLEAILLRKPNWQDFFRNLQTIIIDEAHNFAPVDRGCHLITLIERLCYKLDKSVQRIAITATVGNPNEMLKWLAGSDKNIGKRIFVESAHKKEKDFQIQYFYDNTEEGNEIPANYQRLINLYDLLPYKKSIIFGGSRTNCESLASAINKLNSLKNRAIPIKVRTHHSSVSKYYREEAEKRIKIKNDLESGIDSIISTSTLELGIDIGHLDHVIQLDSITSSSSFLQRVGRTGRRQDKPQFFRGLILDEDDLVLLTAVLSLGLKGVSENLYLPRRAYHILAHQLICLCLQNNGINSKKAWDILSRSYCFSQVNNGEFNELVTFMLENNFLRDVDGELIIGELSEKVFLGANWQKLFAVFSSGPLYEVFNEKNHVGNLDCNFVESMEVPFFFILGGIDWEAYNVKADSRQVFARKTKAGNAPRWKTFNGSDVPIETAKEVGKLLSSTDVPSFLNAEGKTCFQSAQSRIINLNWSNGHWILINDFHQSEIVTFAGDKINRTLAILIKIFGLGQTSSDYKSIIIKSSNSEQVLNIDNILFFINSIKEESPVNSSRFLLKLEENTKSVFFSKFVKCLPDNLISASIAEKSYNFEGLIQELNTNEIIIKIDSNSN
jgi:ATP-dependent helicase Lhr and Lhr-like helicase